MTYTSDNLMNHRKLTLDASTFSQIYDGSDVYEIEVQGKTGNKKTIDILINGSVLLRIERKPRNRKEPILSMTIS
jgi:hypothetical protein